MNGGADFEKFGAVCVAFGDLGTSMIGLDTEIAVLLLDDEWDRLVVGLGPSYTLTTTWRGESGALTMRLAKIQSCLLGVLTSMSRMFCGVSVYCIVWSLLMSCSKL